MRDRDWNPGIVVAGVLISGGLWASFIILQYAAFDFAKLTTGIGVIFIPAGVRLGLILIFRWWGATGVTLANMLVFGDEFDAKGPLEIVLISVIAGFAPLLAVLLSLRLLRIGRTLTEIKPRDLPIISLAAALISATAHNLAFIALGYQDPGTWLGNTITMAFGDFLGCLTVVFLMWFAMSLYKSSTKRNDRNRE